MGKRTVGEWTRVHEISKLDIDAAQGHYTATVHSTLTLCQSPSALLEDLCGCEEISGQAGAERRAARAPYSPDWLLFSLAFFAGFFCWSQLPLRMQQLRFEQHSGLFG